jgi:integrase
MIPVAAWEHTASSPLLAGLDVLDLEVAAICDDIDRLNRKDGAGRFGGLPQQAHVDKTYCVQYRQGGRSRRATIGEHGRLAPEEARSEAKGEARSPCEGVERYPEKGRERFLTIDELGRLGGALTAFEANGGCPFSAAAIRLLALTGARLREVLDAQWQHVDLGRGMIFLPDSKTGKKPIYLSAAAQAVLADLPRHEFNPHVIAGVGLKAKSSLMKPWAIVRRAAGLDGVRLHDLRHSFASAGAGASLGLPIIGKLLGHAQAASTHRYAHLDADPMARAVETIGATIDAAMNRRASGEVIPIGKRSA